LVWLPKLIAAGAVVGGCGGALLLALAMGGRTSLAGVAVGSISFAVIGAWFGFVGGSFYAIFRHGLRDAIDRQAFEESRTELQR
jgi:hypothetical protein